VAVIEQWNEWNKKTITATNSTSLYSKAPRLVKQVAVIEQWNEWNKKTITATNSTSLYS
jgi:hypothetical protein